MDLNGLGLDLVADELDDGGRHGGDAFRPDHGLGPSAGRSRQPAVLLLLGRLVRSQRAEVDLRVVHHVGAEAVVIDHTVRGPVGHDLLDQRVLELKHGIALESGLELVDVDPTGAVAVEELVGPPQPARPALQPCLNGLADGHLGLLGRHVPNHPDDLLVRLGALAEEGHKLLVGQLAIAVRVHSGAEVLELLVGRHDVEAVQHVPEGLGGDDALLVGGMLEGDTELLPVVSNLAAEELLRVVVVVGGLLFGGVVGPERHAGVRVGVHHEGRELVEVDLVRS